MTSEDNLKTETKDGVARAGQVGQETMDGARDAVDAASSNTGDIIDRARAKAREAVGALPGNAGDTLGVIKGGGDEVARRVTRQPVEALLLAGAVGYLVGWAINRP